MSNSVEELMVKAEAERNDAVRQAAMLAGRISLDMSRVSDRQSFLSLDLADTQRVLDQIRRQQAAAAEADARFQRYARQVMS